MNTSLTQLEDKIPGLKELEKTNPVYFKFIEDYFKEYGGNTIQAGRMSDLNEIGITVVTHYIGNTLNPISLYIDLYNEDLDESHIVEIKELIKDLPSFILSIPDEVWINIKNKYDLDESWNNIGRRFRDLGTKILKSLKENKDRELLTDLHELLDTYKQITDQIIVV